MPHSRSGSASAADSGSLTVRLLDRAIRLRNQIFRKGTYFGTEGKPFPLLEGFKAALQDPPGPDVLAFGDSVFERVAHQDEDRRRLSDMLGADLGRRHLTSYSLSQTSYTCTMFDAFLRLAARLGARPKHVILPFNLRCLSPQWDGSPIWQYSQDLAAIQAQIVDPSAPVACLEPVWDDQGVYHATAFASPLSDKRNVGRFQAIIRQNTKDPVAAERRRREILVFHYGMPARNGHRQLNSLTAAVRAAAIMGTQTLVYLTPINMPLIRKLGGEGLEEIIAANTALVAEALADGAGSSGRVIWRDWHDAMPTSAFFHANELTEHLCAEGRAALAAMIVREIAPASSESVEVTRDRHANAFSPSAPV